MGEMLGDKLGIKEEVIIKACSMSMKAHKSSDQKLYVYHKVEGSVDEVVFAFDGLRSIADWKPFDETEIGQTLFPSIRSIGTDQAAMVNKPFLNRFHAVLKQPKFVAEVEKAIRNKNQLVFAGHSSGGGVAILVALWLLETYVRKGSYKTPPHCVTPPLCLTFGSPLIGDRIISHALRREGWAHYFINFVTRYDIVPRIMLTPLSTVERMLGLIIPLKKELVHISNEASELFKTLMNNALYVASHSACKLKEYTDPILDHFSGFTRVSPYRPFGTYIFCTGNGKLAVVENPDAVLQMLFYSAQLTSEEECGEVACKSLNEHMIYENELKSSLKQIQDVVYLDQLEIVPLSSNGSAAHDPAGANTILTDLGLSAHARICLRAAGEFEKQKLEKEKVIDNYIVKIREKLEEIKEYKEGWCKIRNVTYYDSLKLQEHEKDFHANVARLFLAGIFDEIMEKLKRSELPDGFEAREDWIKLGTEYQRLFEPLDIANFYRHLKYKETGPYMGDEARKLFPRPKRYRFIQRWREHFLDMPVDSSSVSCFLAQVEQLIVGDGEGKSFDDLKEDILKLEKKAFEWVSNEKLRKDVFTEELGEDVFFAGSTFSRWWKGLPERHRKESCLKDRLKN